MSKRVMAIQDKFQEWIKRPPTDAVGVDCASNGTRVVRMRKSPAGLSLTGAAILPPVPIHDVMNARDGPFPEGIEALSIPPRVRGRYAALLAPGASHAVVKILRVPESFNVSDRTKIMARLGFATAEGYRVGTRVIQPATARTEAHVLVAALPDRLAEALLELLPNAGLPAPRSIEISELAVINAFCNDARMAEQQAEPHGLIHFDHDFSLVALFNRGQLSQLRTFPFGLAAVLGKITKALNVDEQTATGVLMDGAFDISHLIEDDAREVRSQYMVCRDFMERSENCELKKLHMSGPAALTRTFLAGSPMAEVQDQWDALHGFTEQNGGALSDDAATEPWRFSAAVGACIGILETP